MTVEREQLLRAAAEYLGRRPNATQDEIATAAGVSRATLHRHFSGKSALLTALEELAISEMRRALEHAELDRGPAAEALHRLITACEPVSPYLALLYTQTQDLDTDQSLAAWAEIDAAISALFERGQRSGEFRPDLSSAWLTEALYNLVAGAAWAIQNGRVAGRDFHHNIVELLLNGVQSS
ncbi:TetR family transcriptional regulator [Mycolicibacterium phlei]|jgi:TetR/AcrR family transcriptional repressor of mexCD-oprJ operon|uniref:TetR family transcriptional regulator n=1 Tax=Mycolicibacterium phlei DSM 43239 = CCUG 21000 TaxID=1226750 RepID=A0A5N5VD16_MYCPH|nr:TetR/AcrR family transcriptional regulator [Mycolicibacterium phlei]VEG11555.1 TetR family transcriptional regulator [Mycobacteroides chelonae]AMO63461.1 Bacterial regulatory protein, tetR family [Mycolicibacterium phlei]EID14524.1 TetR family transcriptional regulator [Mycolicibacterium phlei RIVM601174]KAB7759688.1 TetR family transcriptional regulator [Mycolicibacterium phlei DSM 43239 = CCUG 21000]KXW62511.1 TetR family transcriptional regulator [Mycolicibacterium phlei DSM 43070]